MVIEVFRQEPNLAAAAEQAKREIQSAFLDYSHFELSLTSVSIRWERDENMLYRYEFHGGPR